MASHTVLPLSSDTLGFAEVIAPRDENGDENGSPNFFQTGRMKRLSTPWPVCLTRAEQLADCRLGKGVIIDPACGSGAQLFAYCEAIEKVGIGIELDADSAVLAAANGALLGMGEPPSSKNNHLIEDGFVEGNNPNPQKSENWMDESSVLVGDGMAATSALKSVGLSGRCVAALHVDPARPSDAQNHSLDEMQPPIGKLLDNWAAHMVIGSQGPAFIIDLSPRLLPTQQKEVESLLRSHWPSSPITWEWVSTGRGRIDRLTIWFGAAAVQATPARMLRLLADGTVVSFSGPRTSVSLEAKSDPQKGNHLTIVDAALLSSGLQGQWLREALPADAEHSWVKIDGRRPLLLSNAPVDVSKSLVRAFVATTGEITSKLKVQPTVENLSPILVSANAAYLSRLTLRCKMNPSDQPKLQAQLDRGLQGHARGKEGFLIDVDAVSGHNWYICRSP